MPEINFHKYHGAGNDFIMLNEMAFSYHLDEMQIKHLCDRHLGIGADGLICIRKNSQYDFSMIYYNSDGKEGSMCGNGGRCAVLFTKQQGITGDNCLFKSVDGLHRAIILKEGRNEGLVRLKMRDVDSVKRINEQLFIDTGSPHVIIPVTDINKMDVDTEGRNIRFHKAYAPKGTNVNFIEQDGKGFLIRTYERGVEAETLACGTGVTAAAIAVNTLYGSTSPVEFRARGGILNVAFNADGGSYSDIWLEGPAVCSFKGNTCIK